MTDWTLLYLSRHDVESLGLEMAEIIDVVEKGFFELGHGRVEMPPKPGKNTGMWTPGLGSYKEKKVFSRNYSKKIKLSSIKPL